MFDYFWKKSFSEVEMVFSETEKDSITKLDLSNKGLTKFPMNILKLKNLKELNMGFNFIEEIPENIDELENLERMSFYDNKIKKIPKRIGNMKNLTYITFRNNQLTTIPDEVENLTQCSGHIYCSGNPIIIESVSPQVMKMLGFGFVSTAH